MKEWLSSDAVPEYRREYERSKFLTPKKQEVKFACK